MSKCATCNSGCKDCDDRFCFHCHTRNSHAIGAKVSTCICTPSCFDVNTCPGAVLRLAPSCGCVWRHKITSSDGAACPDSKNARQRIGENGPSYNGYCRGEWCYTCLPHRQIVGHCGWNCLPMDVRRSESLFPARIDLYQHGHHDDFSYETNKDYWHMDPTPDEVAPSVPLTELRKQLDISNTLISNLNSQMAHTERCKIESDNQVTALKALLHRNFIRSRNLAKLVKKKYPKVSLTPNNHELPQVGDPTFGTPPEDNEFSHSDSEPPQRSRSSSPPRYNRGALGFSSKE